MKENKKEKNVIDLPDIQQFLNTSRTMDRQIKIFSKTDIDGKYVGIVNLALNKVKSTIDSYLEEEKLRLGKDSANINTDECSIRLVKDKYEKKENVLDMYIQGLLDGEKKEVKRVFNKFSNIILIAWEKFGEKLVIRNIDNNNVYEFESNETDEKVKIKILECELNKIM